ncbi:hypothetical protein JTB14_019069 [Gonioctena quinquepunctata]|nr:hypothetical protein JTB14_019069 [Gonioctena quinquepunctata]
MRGDLTGKMEQNQDSLATLKEEKKEKTQKGKDKSLSEVDRNFKARLEVKQNELKQKKEDKEMSSKSKPKENIKDKKRFIKNINPKDAMEAGPSNTYNKRTDSESQMSELEQDLSKELDSLEKLNAYKNKMDHEIKVAISKKVMENMKQLNQMYTVDNSVDFPQAVFLQASNDIFKKHWTEHFTEKRKVEIDICNEKIAQFRKSFNMPKHEVLREKDPLVVNNKNQQYSPNKTVKQQKGPLLERIRLTNRYDVLATLETPEEDTEDTDKTEKTKPGRQKKKPIKQTQTQTKTNKTMPPIVIDNITPGVHISSSLECPVYQKIAQQHEARIAKSRQPSDQPRYVDAPSPERKAWNEKKDWTDRQSGPRVNSRIPQADHGGSRDDSRKPPNRPETKIQATEGSPNSLSFPPTPSPHMPGKIVMQTIELTHKQRI